MKSTAPTLRFGVPAPFDFEAPSSWLSRLALAQGCTLEELLEFLDLGFDGVDLDRSIHGKTLSELRRRCSLPHGAFAVAGGLMSGLRRVRLPWYALLTDSRERPRFRYCPLCLKQRRLAHLDIHWRFADWRYCPDHNCLMEDACCKCGAAVSYPCDMAKSKAGRAGSASQGKCQACRSDLSAAVPCMINPTTSTALTELEACWLLNGRALLASLLKGNARYRAEGIGTAAIGRRAYFEWLPRPAVWDVVERRVRQELLSRPINMPEERLTLSQFRATRWGRVISVERINPAERKA